MKKALIIGAALVVLFFGAKMLTQDKTVVRENFAVSSENAPQMVQKTDGNGSFFSSFATAKELTPAQKKLEELGFYPDRFQSIQIKNKSTK